MNTKTFRSDMNKSRKTGRFIVEINPIGKPVNVLAHYRKNEGKFANAALASIRSEGRTAFVVEDAVVDFVLRAAKYWIKGAAKAYKCENPEGGDACGRCGNCTTRIGDELAGQILDSADIPRSDITDSLCRSVWGNVGRVTCFLPWMEEFTDEEADLASMKINTLEVE